MMPHPYSGSSGIGQFTRAGAAGAAVRGGVLVSMGTPTLAHAKN
jgi:hypothetical protein